MKKITAALAVSTLALAACGGSDGGSGGGSADKDKIYNELISDGSEGLDTGCLRSAVDGLSSDDAKFIAENIDENGFEGAPPAGASESAIAFVGSLFECIDLSDIDLGDLSE